MKKIGLVLIMMCFIFKTSYALDDDETFFRGMAELGYSRSFVTSQMNSLSSQGETERAVAIAVSSNLYELFQKAQVTNCELYGIFLLNYSLALIKVNQPNVALYYALESESFWGKRTDAQIYYVASLMRCAQSYIEAGDLGKGALYLEKIRSLEYDDVDKLGLEFLGAIDELEAEIQYKEANYSLAEELYKRAQERGSKSDLTPSILQCKLKNGNKSEVLSYLKANIDVNSEITTEKQGNLMDMLCQILGEDDASLSEAIAIEEKNIKYFKLKKRTLSLNYATVLFNYFALLLKSDNPGKAIEIAERAANIYENLMPNSQIKYAQFLITAAPYAEKNGYHELAAKYALRASEIKFNYIAYNMMDNARREKVWGDEGKWFLSTLPSLAVANPNEDMLKATYNGLLIGKGMLLNTELSIKDIVNRQGGDLKNLFEKYTQAKEQLESPHAYEADEQIRANYKRLNTEFSQACFDNPQLKVYLNYTWEDIKNKLQPGEKAIEFFQTNSEFGKSTYNALVISADLSAPKLITLCDSSILDAVKLDVIKENKASTLLYDAVWKPLENSIMGATRVFFSADGALHQLPIEVALTDVSKIVPIRVSSTRQLLTRDEISTLPDAADVYGGFKYGEKIANSSKESLRAGVSDLPGTEQEAIECTKLLNNASVKAVQHIGLTGTEDTFKRLSNSDINLVHVATHSMLMTKIGLKEITNSSDSLSDDIMDRTALLFSGANRTIKSASHRQDTNDGILTASEISKMDLHNVDFVVLSACETALGDVSGEGVFGLQRGFKKAGVKTIMMSLWKVDDDATMMFMELFYKSWLTSSDHNRIKALQEAQDKVKSFKGVINGKYRDFSKPQYWASFILLDAI